MPTDLGIDARLRRTMGRPARAKSVAVRFTDDEAALVARAASKEGLAFREWARVVLLSAARQKSEKAIFTELIALRQFLNEVLRGVACGDSISPAEYDGRLSEVKARKHAIAAEVLDQYRTTSGAEVQA